jgi:hypothetical protein
MYYNIGIIKFGTTKKQEQILEPNWLKDIKSLYLISIDNITTLSGLNYSVNSLNYFVPAKIFVEIIEENTFEKTDHKFTRHCIRSHTC